MSVTRKLLSLALVALLGGCGIFGGPLPHERRYAAKKAQERLAQLEKPGLVIGDFTLAKKAVVDGDTIKVMGLDSSLRLSCVDTEETFKKEKEKRAYEQGWEKYLAEMRGNSSRPVKMATPVGMDAKQFAQDFFSGVTQVRLERDHPKEIRDFYNRYLAYVLVEKNGKWLNYNVEAVRAGMSPYFMKYGYSRRFHKEFVEAQAEAQVKKIGIWDPSKQHYPDYEERLKWWTQRADFIAAFEKDAEGKDNYIELTNWDAPRRLDAMVGKEVVILGAISEIKLGDKGPTRVVLARRLFKGFPIIFFDKDVFLSTDVARRKGEYIRVRGIVTNYRDRYKQRDILQIVVDRPSQITTEATEVKP